jgi:hypothetical protein
MRDDYTEILEILDRSGSMSSVKDDTIGGFNQFLRDQLNEPGTAKLTLVQFNHQIETTYEGMDLKEVPPLTAGTYRPDGFTALRDAIGYGINSLGRRLEALTESERPGRVIVVIHTDGLENSSREFTQRDIASLIDHQRRVYNWQFMFMGANQDAVEVGKDMNIPTVNAISYAANSAGTRQVGSHLSRKVSDYRASGQSATLDWMQAEREIQVSLGAQPDSATRNPGNPGKPEDFPTEPSIDIEELKRRIERIRGEADATSPPAIKPE